MAGDGRNRPLSPDNSLQQSKSTVIGRFRVVIGQKSPNRLYRSIAGGPLISVSRQIGTYHPYRAPVYGEGRSVEGEGRRRGCSKKEKENRENLDANPFVDPDPTLPSLDDPDPKGNSEAATRATEEVVFFIASSATLRLLLRQRSEMSTAFDVFIAFFAKYRR
ncbi:hypothetical protein BHE74_00041714 [Ensete ventricosum]|uniref:Uncharacterized protein n=1 Tax=Ensete ventricosum TaxID=4639 RepID=A0A444G3X0_ENSVE|nr:hypothetical protein GW17_00005939 [Ensete ventricosum]RWW51898.1 hypothetical protein BHE74_00041714 [Ensete ventricosum]RZR73449.1 hypothetical protein BHM03_00024494 [Ensete ventricosum]